MLGYADGRPLATPECTLHDNGRSPATLTRQAADLTALKGSNGDNRLMSKHEEAELILKLYDLRREETMRKARDWFFLEFNPESMADYQKAMFSEHSGHVRMVASYWDMAAALVNHGAISPELFNETNGEHFTVFAKIEPILSEMRSAFGPQYMANLEKLIDAAPNGRERLTRIRERIKNIRAQVATMQSQTSGQN